MSEQLRRLGGVDIAVTVEPVSQWIPMRWKRAGSIGERALDSVSTKRARWDFDVTVA